MPFEMVLNELLEELYGSEEKPVEGENKGENKEIEEGEQEQ